MIRKYHNHKLQTNPWHIEEEPHNNVFGDLNQYKIVGPLFDAAYAAPNKGTSIPYSFSKINIFSNAV